MNEQLTPMMRKYLETKEEYPDCILFYRLGDFYEMFFEDAKCVSKELELTLTGKSCGLKERAPMCGVPFHSADTYVHRLVKKGYKVAICEQVEDPKLAKGLVKREVTRIVTPGTEYDIEDLSEGKNNYLMGIVTMDKRFGLAFCDVSTGDFYATEVDTPGHLLDEINKYMPSEILCSDSFYMSGIPVEDLQNRLHISISKLPASSFEESGCYQELSSHFGADLLQRPEWKGFTIGITAAGCVLGYLKQTQKISLDHLQSLIPYQTSRYMILDRNTRRNLELTETLREKEKRGSLLWVLDKTKTAMGARKLRFSLEQPLMDEEEIQARYDAIETLNNDMITREEIREYLGPVYDLERLLTKISYGSANPRDLIALKSSLAMLPYIRGLCEGFQVSYFQNILEEMDPLADIYSLIDQAIADEPPLLMHEGGIIKEGYRDEVERLRHAKTDGKTWLSQLETREKESTGIKNLKVKYNKVFGYYLEVTKSYQDLVPPNWIRKQTLANAERYTTEELKEIEDAILGASDRLNTLEFHLFQEVREEIYTHMTRIQRTARAIASLDMITSLAYVSEKNNYVKPTINHKGFLSIKDGRHPVVEKLSDGGLFVPNDVMLDHNQNRMLIITGPNMAGKSTYMRQTALICLMAQVGCYVPASEADICLVDQIFTRVGASDDLTAGQSTFMVEMSEVANILNNASNNSLIILDEIGRGTSTFDGLSIAWSVVEYIANKDHIGAKTLFATHYHELTELEGVIPGVKNCCIAVKEDGEDIVFLRKIIPGGTDKSYGIQVAKLAGVPEGVLRRAREIATLLEQEELNLPLAGNHPKEPVMEQLSIFDTISNHQFDEKDLLFEIRDIDLSTMTPMEALIHIDKWQKQLKDQW